jgi:hypothetical protein
VHDGSQLPDHPASRSETCGCCDRTRFEAQGYTGTTLAVQIFLFLYCSHAGPHVNTRGLSTGDRFMRQTHQFLAAILMSISVMAIAPAGAAQAKQIDAQISANLGAPQQADAATSTNRNRESLQAAQPGKKTNSMKGSRHARHVAQVTQTANGKATRRAIAIRRARAAKAKQEKNT